MEKYYDYIKELLNKPEEWKEVYSYTMKYGGYQSTQRINDKEIDIMINDGIPGKVRVSVYTLKGDKVDGFILWVPWSLKCRIKKTIKQIKRMKADQVQRKRNEYLGG